MKFASLHLLRSVVKKPRITLKCENTEGCKDWKFDYNILQGDFFLYAKHIFIDLPKNSRELIQLTSSTIIIYPMKKSSNPKDP